MATTQPGDTSQARSFRTCPYCGKDFDPRGITSHAKTCKRLKNDARREQQLARELKGMRSEGVHSKRRFALKSGRHNQPESSEHAHDVDLNINEPGPSQPAQHEEQLDVRDVEPLEDEEAISTFGSDQELPPSFVEDTDKDANRLLLAELPNIDVNPAVPLEADAHDHQVPTLSSDDRSPSSSPEHDDFKIEYHPSLQQSPRICRFHEYQRDRPAGLSRDELLAHLDQPWRPFSTRSDFEFAELALRTGMSAKDVDDMLSLIRRVASGDTPDLTFRSHADISAAWENASRSHSQFRVHDIMGVYKNEERHFQVHARPLWSWIVEQVKDPLLASHFHWDAQRLYKYNGYSQQWIRFIDEPYTANTMWKVQSALPSGGKPLGIILFADKSKLSSFGTQKGYPVIARIANLDVGVRNGIGPGGGQVVGFLPIVPEEAAGHGKAGFANFKGVIWHSSFWKLLEVVARFSRLGCKLKCGDRIERRLFPYILILSADYEEQCIMALIRGLNGLCPCPVCLIARDKQSIWPESYPQREAGVMQSFVTQKVSKTEKEKQLKKVSLRDVENVFWKVAFSDPHQALSFDRLHAYHLGLFGKHLWPEFKVVIEKYHTNIAANIDTEAKKFPIWRNLYHFEKGVLYIEFGDGSKYEDLSKILVFIACRAISASISPRGYALLKLIRVYLECDMYAGFNVHTEETLEAFKQTIQRWYQEVQKYQQMCTRLEQSNQNANINDTTSIHDEDSEDYGDEDNEFLSVKNWNFPKNHSHSHVIDDIFAKGVTRNYSTRPNESMHGYIRWIYLWMTNFKQIEGQIARIDHRFVCAAAIQARIVAQDTILKEIEEENKSEAGDIANESKTLYQFHQIYLGSRQSSVPLGTISELHTNDSAFTNFLPSLNTFFKRWFKILPSEDLPKGIDLQKFSLPDHHPITICRYLKVNFESKVSWQEETDYLRCSPSFHHRERYDSVIVQVGDSTYMFGQLRLAFVCAIQDKRYAVGLIWPMNILASNPSSIGNSNSTNAAELKMDRELGLCRVRVKQRPEFIPLRSIVRGAVLYKDPGKVSDYLAVDTVDSDMFLRLKELFPYRLTA